MKTISVNLYSFSELSESAKQKARDKYREWSDYFYADFVIEDAKNIADILGIEFDTRSVPLMNGKTRSEPVVYYSGFYHQGSGASFAGSYKYKKGAKKAILKYAPQDSELHRIADELQAIQKRNFYSLRASISQSGRDCHEYSMSVDCSNWLDDYREISDSDCEDVLELMRDFARWIYSQLQAEYEYRMSDECIDETLEANEYEFLEDGTIQ